MVSPFCIFQIKMPAIQAVIISTLVKTSYLRRLPYHIN